MQFSILFLPLGIVRSKMSQTDISLTMPSGNKPLPELMLIKFCVTKPQWVKLIYVYLMWKATNISITPHVFWKLAAYQMLYWPCIWYCDQLFRTRFTIRYILERDEWHQVISPHVCVRLCILMPMWLIIQNAISIFFKHSVFPVDGSAQSTARNDTLSEMYTWRRFRF